MSNLKVAVRVRPMSERELQAKSQCAVSVENGVVTVTNLKVPEHHAGDSRERIREFAFDFCFNEESTQDDLFSVIESEVSCALTSRFHACVLAYGQSSTGKTYSMMGTQLEPGLTPRLCQNIFRYFQSAVTEEEAKCMRTSVSYLEIYNERVQDLLTSGNNGRSLKVREDPQKGPYVQGLREQYVSDGHQLVSWLSTGNGNRRVAATSNNRRSSRSHSVLTVSCIAGGGLCRLQLVDLAGSEKATSRARAPRLKEAANINKSLVALGNVICALSDQSGRSGKNFRKRFIPYRDSVLTWLLKETLGGNSKTVMIATISPSSACYSETVNTLRFGVRAQQIVNRPQVNGSEHAHAHAHTHATHTLIRHLRAEILRLRNLLQQKNAIDVSPTQHQQSTSSPHSPQLEMTEHLLSSTESATVQQQELYGRGDREQIQTIHQTQNIDQHSSKLDIDTQNSTLCSSSLDNIIEDIQKDLEDLNSNSSDTILRSSISDNASLKEQSQSKIKDLDPINPDLHSRSLNQVNYKSVQTSEDQFVTFDSKTNVQESPNISAKSNLVKTTSIPDEETDKQDFPKLSKSDSLDSSSIPEEDPENLGGPESSNSNKSTPVHFKKDTLIPVIDITSTVAPKFQPLQPKPAQPTRLNRKLSVDLPKSILGKLRKDFGSHETLNVSTKFEKKVPLSKNGKTKTIGVYTDNLTNLKGSTENESKVSKIIALSTENLSKTSKTTDGLPKYSLLETLQSKATNLSKFSPSAENFSRSSKSSLENLSKPFKISSTPPKVDKSASPSRSSSISESSGVSTPKQGVSVTKIQVHRRSEVVAAVTQRLYSQQFKRKELPNKERKLSMDLPRQTLCSSARIGLRELTRKAMQASKRKINVDTQTEDASTIRMKEKSTDVQDIEVALLEVKEVGVAATTDMKHVGIECHVQNSIQSFKLTRSCSVQTEEPTKNQSVSFTKYLQNPPLSIHSCTRPIYTSSVNINVQHNYPSMNMRLPPEDISDDSLEDCAQNVQYSTPDLISNHNSLEKTSKPSISDTEMRMRVDEPMSHAIVDYPQTFLTSEYFATDATEHCVADCSLVPPTKKPYANVSFPVVCAPEIRKIDEFSETCSVLSASEVKLAEPVTTFEGYYKPVESASVLNDTRKLKSIIKPKNNLPLPPRDCSTDETDSESSVSLSKKVRFSPHVRRKEMFDVLANFMDEASTLMLKLNDVTKQVEQAGALRNKRSIVRKHNKQSQQLQHNGHERDAYDSDSVANYSTKHNTFNKSCNCDTLNSTKCTKECYVQTWSPLHDASCQTSPNKHLDENSAHDSSDTENLENKWSDILKNSCDKLEQCVKLAEHKSRENERRRFHNNEIFDSDCLHKFPQPFSTDAEWKYCPTDYSSLETSHSASDYGSLPRRQSLFRTSPYRNYSPKAYMKQLVAMRKQIIETSRNDLMNELSEH